jgi:transcriptional regulator with XRE-family HTH domain
MPHGVKVTAEQEEDIIAALRAKPHALQVARDSGRSFATVWRRAEAAGIELTAGRDAKGYKRLSPERRAKVEEARRANPKATQEEIARAADVSRVTVSRIERGDRRGASRLLTSRP